MTSARALVGLHQLKEQPAGQIQGLVIRFGAIGRLQDQVPAVAAFKPKTPPGALLKPGDGLPRLLDELRERHSDDGHRDCQRTRNNRDRPHAAENLLATGLGIEDQMTDDDPGPNPPGTR